jgi:hypothetical protein
VYAGDHLHASGRGRSRKCEAIQLHCLQLGFRFDILLAISRHKIIGDSQDGRVGGSLTVDGCEATVLEWI